MIYKRELMFAICSGLLAVLGIIGMPYLVASPKLLFGRSLSAIPPNLFPTITLALIAILSFGIVVLALGNLRKSRSQPVTAQTESEYNSQDWIKKGVFFLLLVAYGLLLKPMGFLLTSAMVICATSLLLGNRNWLQIGLISVASPICLYLVATRGMLVSLPELNQIELFYAGLITWFK